MTIKDIEKFIKNSVEKLMSMDDSTTFFYIINDKIAIYIGWGGGFDEKDTFYLHSKKNPEYCVCIKIAENNPASRLWDDVYMPWYKETEEVYDTDCGISVNENYSKLADYILYDCNVITDYLEDGILTF